MIESPDKMYDKLKRMLNKNSDTLHPFIELGGLSKIYECLHKFYTNNDENQIIKWLEILNHDNFPIDTELIRNIGLGNFINKYLSKSHSTLTNSIQQKWYNFAKAESEQHSKRQLQSNKKVSIDITQQQIIFKRTDKPSSIKKHKLKHKHNYKQINSILKSGKMNSKMRNITISNDIYNLDDEQHKDINKDINSENKNKNVDGDILEYVDIDDDDIAMCDSQNTDDDDDDDDDDDIDIFDGNNNNNNNDIEVQIQWSLPMKMKIDCELKINTNFKGMKEEEERIKKIKYNDSGQCIELVSSCVINKEMNNRQMEVQMLTDYPHWSEIEKYRKENDE